MVGGYKLISLGKNNITSVGVNIPGVYERIESSIGKPILLTNIMINGKEMNSFYGIPQISGTDYTIPYSISSSGFSTLRVSSADLVRAVGVNFSMSTQNSINEDGPSASM